MNTRRQFIRDLSLTGLSIPFATKLVNRRFELEDIVYKNYSSDDEYWKAIRMQFPLKEGQTYFNNGTIGPMPGYVLNKVMNHMQHYAVHGAEIDYKGNGEELLNGYFPYVDIRTKLGKIINADYKEISLVQNATFGMNFVANGLDLQAGDEIINTNQEHGGGFAA